MAIQTDFNELLNEILTAYRNQFGGDSIAEGSVLFVKASCSASMHWGLRQALKWVMDQMFVTSADRAHKELHAAEFGILTASRTDAQIEDDVLAAKRSKMAGGNRYDYEAWARSVSHDDERITDARVVPLARGEGTFDIVVVSSADRTEASPEILNKVYQKIQNLRPIGAGFSWGVRVAGITPQDATIHIRGAGIHWAQAASVAAIRAYIANLPLGATIQRSIITSIMHDYGAAAAEVVYPPADIVPVWDPSAGKYGKFVNITILLLPEV
ncbi:MAG: baseplate J/gp47 family protein [Chitinispirillia bacterium]|nr:baseplate J/gp47 family protein [Chitinispirillia bacterium]MCL2268609.1 baseplate J/gp47 family protein [Chitinispirillia bacterium]